MIDSRNSHTVLRKAMWLFFVIFLSIGTLLAALMFLFYNLQTESHLDSLRIRERQAVELEARTALTNLRIAVSDLMHLRQQNELTDYLSGQTSALKPIGQEYLILSNARGLYDQVRLLGADGREKVRINRVNGQGVIIPPHQLQDKKNRYYVLDTLRRADGEIFISPLDLNIEQGQVERPFKPMIRFGTPIVDAQGQKQGLIVLNYLADIMLEQLRQISRTALGDTMLVNSDGYWLLSPNPDDEWGFMFSGNRDRTFIAQYPDEWHQMFLEESGQIVTDRGMFTYTTLLPLQEEWLFKQGAEPIDTREQIDIAGSEYAWKLLSHVPPQVMGDYGARLKSRLLLLGAVLFFLAATGSFFIALALTRHRLYQAQLEVLAHFDLLTGLPNRALFFDRLMQTLELARRYTRPFGLLYVDLDNFKDVNDTLGHDAGDRLLATVAKRLEQTVRKSDTVARLGGDEFVVLLSEVEGREGGESAAEKILDVLKEPFKLRGATRTVTASIGISLYPEDGETADDLLNRSDQAMYHSKMKGKNQYR